MESIEKILLSAGNFILFILASVIFLPAFFIVTYLQDFWSDKLSELFGV
jgi:hypothetical protein